jgi:hypothetical protein
MPLLAIISIQLLDLCDIASMRQGDINSPCYHPESKNIVTVYIYTLEHIHKLRAYVFSVVHSPSGECTPEYSEYSYFYYNR